MIFQHWNHTQPGFRELEPSPPRYWSYLLILTPFWLKSGTGVLVSSGIKKTSGRQKGPPLISKGANEDGKGPVPATGLLKGGVPVEKTNAVRMVDYNFSPQRITVEAGSKVTFTNGGSTPHNAAGADAGGWDTGLLEGGQAATVTFNQPGTYNYYLSSAPLHDRADHRDGAGRPRCACNRGGFCCA
jgi:plastocyanin